MSEQNKEGIPCKVMTEEDAGMLSERIVDMDDAELVRRIDLTDSMLEAAACVPGAHDRDFLGLVELFDEQEGG